MNAVSSSTYGDSKKLPKVEEEIGKPLSPYAAVIPLWIKKLINHERPVINGDGSYSRDYTYIDNIMQANEKALFTPEDQILKGQREYYNLELDEHKYLLQMEEKAATHNSIIPTFRFFLLRSL